MFPVTRYLHAVVSRCGRFPWPRNSPLFVAKQEPKQIIPVIDFIHLYGYLILLIYMSLFSTQIWMRITPIEMDEAMEWSPPASYGGLHSHHSAYIYMEKSACSQ